MALNSEWNEFGVVSDSEGIPQDNMKHLIIEVYLSLFRRQRKIRRKSVHCQGVWGALAHEKRDPWIAIGLPAFQDERPQHRASQCAVTEVTQLSGTQQS